MAALLTPLIRNLAIRGGLLDQVGKSSRKIHGRPVPRLGGIAIVAGFYAPLIGLAILETGVGTILYGQLQSALALMMAGVVIALLGVFDDVRGANARTKFAVQTVVAVLLYYSGFRISQVALPFGFSLPLGTFSLPVTVLWIVGVINAVNLIDGLDGLAGGVALFAVGTNFAIAVMRGDPLMMLFMACLGGGILGFLFYNFNPASIFMGDTGSLFLGLVLAVTSLQTNQKSSTVVTLIVPIITLGLPIADTLLALGRRAVQGRPLFSADKEHIHHRLLAKGFTHRKTVLILYGACCLLGLTALSLTYANSVQTALILAVLSLLFIFAFRRLGFFHLDRTSYVNAERRRNKRLRGEVRTVGQRLDGARTADEVWALVSRFVQNDLGANKVALKLASLEQSGELVQFEWSRGEDAQDCFPIEVEDAMGPVGMLEVGWSDGRTDIHRSDEIALEVLSDHVADAWRRLGSEAGALSGRGKRLRIVPPQA